MKLSLRLCWDSHGQGEPMKELWILHTSPHLALTASCVTSPHQVKCWWPEGSGRDSLPVTQGTALGGTHVLQLDRLGHAGSLWGGLSWVSLVAGEGALHSGMRRLCPWEGWDAVPQTHSTSSRYQRKKTCWQSTNVLLWLFSHCMVKPYITLIRINLSENKGIYYFSQL